MKQLYKKLVFQRTFFIFVSFLILQQVISASSTYFLNAFTESTQNQSDLYFYLGAFLTSLILPYFPGGLCLVYLKKWELGCIGVLVQNFLSENVGKIKNYSDNELKEVKTSCFAKELDIISGDFTGLSYDLLSSGLSVLLNVAVIGCIIDTRFIFIYLVTFIGVLLVFKKFNPIIANAHSQLQEKRVGHSKHLFNFWDNIVLNNSYSLKNWISKHNADFQNYLIAGGHTEKVSQLVSILIAMVTFLPSAALCFYLLAGTNGNQAKIMLLVGIIPRLFNILGNTHVLISLLATWPGVCQQITGMSEISKTQNNLDFNSRIKKDAIRVWSGETSYLLKDFLEDMKSKKLGRFCIRGENGAGKSTTLQMIKEGFQGDSFYLPAKESLYFSENFKGSTGEMLMAKIKEIKKLGVDLLLLDEWDANLDIQNRGLISLELEELAKNTLIVEVRHT